MKNPLTSLSMTVVMGVILTVIMVGALAGINDWSEAEPMAPAEIMDDSMSEDDSMSDDDAGDDDDGT